MIPRLLVLLAALCAAPVAGAAEQDPGTVVERYMAAIAASDWEAMAAFLAEDAHYEDRTMAHFDRPAIDLRGPDAIVAFWRRAAAEAGSGAMHFEVRRAFVAGPVVVLDQRVFVDNDGAAWGMPGFEFTGEMDVISIVEVRDGEIAWHLDSADYAAAFGQIDQLRRAYRAGGGEAP